MFSRSFTVLPLCCLLAPLSVAQTKHPVTFNDLQTIRRIDQLSISPDGQWLAYISSDNLWIAPVTSLVSGRLLGPASKPLWAPDSRHLAYYATAAHRLQLHVFDLSTARSNIVTNLDEGVKPDRATAFIGAFGSHNDALIYSWSPASDSIVFASQITNTAAQTSSKPAPSLQEGQPLVLTTNTPPSWTLARVFFSEGGIWPYLDPSIKNSRDTMPTINDQLFITDIHTGHVRQLTTGQLGYFTPDWSPDGKYILCVSAEGRPLSGWGAGPTNLYVVNPASGETHSLTSDNLYKTVPQISPDGQFIGFHSQDTPGNSSLVVIPASGGQPINLTQTLDRQPWEFRWNAHSNSIFFTFQDGRSMRLAEVDLATTHINPVLPSTDEPGSRSNLSVSRTNVVSWVQSDGSSPEHIYSITPGSSTATPMPLDLNPQMKTWSLGKQQLFHWRNSRGEDLDGILITPPDYQEGHKYPLIVDAYPLVVSSFQGEPMWGNQAWASQGYVVFFPTSRAPHVVANPYASRQFSQSAKGANGLELMFDDVMSGIDELIQQRIVDENRIGLYGFSNGGAVATQLLAKTSRFKCAVIDAPALSVDWTSPFLLNTLPKLLADLVGGTPWEVPDQYVQLSVAYKMDKITTPTLLADGDADSLFLLGTIELYNGLRWLGRDTTLLRYPNQGHELEGPALKDFFQRAMTFFDKHLKTNGFRD